MVVTLSKELAGCQAPGAKTKISLGIFSALLPGRNVYVRRYDAVMNSTVDLGDIYTEQTGLSAPHGANNDLPCKLKPYYLL